MVSFTTATNLLFTMMPYKNDNNGSGLSLKDIATSFLNLYIFVPFQPLYPSTLPFHFWSLKCFKCL